jgi:hypothetical protein
MGRNNKAALLAATLGTGLLLSGCVMPVADPAPLPPPVYDKRPVDDGFWRAAPPPPVWVDSAPDSTQMAEAADPIDDYRWIDTAEGLARAIGSAPPDFTFRFDGREAYAWVSNEGEMLIVEPSPLGVIQYFYLPRAAAPYLVRDVYESYAFEGPRLVAWFDATGQLMMDTPSPRSEDRAIALHRRGREILAASYQRRWDSEAATSYSSQVFLGFGFGAYDSGWAGGWQPHWRDRPEWRDRRDRRRDYERERRRADRLEDERRARDDHARRFDGWRRGGRRGAPPAMMPIPESPVTAPEETPAEQLRRPRPGRMEGGDAIQPIRIEPRRERPVPVPRTASPVREAPPRATPPPADAPPPATSAPPVVDRPAPPPVRTPRPVDEGRVRPEAMMSENDRAEIGAGAFAAETNRRDRAMAEEAARTAQIERQQRAADAEARRAEAMAREQRIAAEAGARARADAERNAAEDAQRAMAAERARQAEDMARAREEQMIARAAEREAAERQAAERVRQAEDMARAREAQMAARAAAREAGERQAAEAAARAEARAAEMSAVERRGRIANEDGEEAARPD